LIIFTALDLPNYISVRGGPPPKTTHILLIFLVLPLLFIDSRQIILFFSNKIGIWFVVYTSLLVLHLVYILSSSSDDHANQIIVDFTLFFLVILYGIIVYDSGNRFTDMALKIIAWVIPLIIIVDFFRPGLIYPIATPGSVLARGAGFYINPNRAGEAALLFLVLSLPLLSLHLRVALFILVGLGVFFTFSRAAILGWFLLCIASRNTRQLPGYFIFVPIIGFIAVLLVGSFLEFFLRTYLGLDSDIANIIDRLAFFQGGGSSDFSSNERSEMVVAGLQLFAENPFFGSGAGATSVWQYSAGPHNQFVAIAAEFGLVGLILWLSIILIIFACPSLKSQNLHIIAACLTIFFSFFSHNILQSGYWLIGFVLLCRPRCQN
jgi:O-antigen ligase